MGRRFEMEEFLDRKFDRARHYALVQTAEQLRIRNERERERRQRAQALRTPAPVLSNPSLQKGHTPPKHRRDYAKSWN